MRHGVGLEQEVAFLKRPRSHPRNPEAERYVSFEEAAEESRGFGESHVLREYRR
ncbi:MAG: hypothetical protein R3223_07185 [Longimicrobiales bacterium]|nr:hypothetical protein [Longimicrobiales bacterium]